MSEVNLFIFRRDFRLYDNTGLIELSKKSLPIVCCFIFDSRQILENEYRSVPAMRFMCESLIDLDGQIKKLGGKLNYLFGLPHEVLDKLLSSVNINTVAFNADYTAFSKTRDNKIAEIVKKHKKALLITDDILLNKNHTKTDGERYKKFTPYYITSVKTPIKACESFTGKLSSLIIPQTITIDKFYNNIKTPDYTPAVSGGRSNASLVPIPNYAQVRNQIWNEKSTSHLSAFIKFGCVSIREVYHAFKNDSDFIKQLYWRDFYYNYMMILLTFPEGFKHQLHQSPIPWRDMNKVESKEIFQKWCQGETGYPIIDAAMRQLNQTGYMHNRGRLITSNWLTKVGKIHWTYGEKYFAQKLIDYDPAVNNGNWQWSAGTGADSQPFYRIFSPDIQVSKFDPDLKYIHKYVPELRKYKIESILGTINDPAYPKKCLDFNKEKQEILNIIKKTGGTIDDDSDSETDSDSKSNTETAISSTQNPTKYQGNKTIAQTKITIGGIKNQKSRNKSKSRSRSNSRNKSKSRSRSNSRNSSTSKSKNRSRSNSRNKSKNRTRSNSRNSSKSKSRNKSKSRSRSNSRNRSKKRSVLRKKIWTKVELNTLENKKMNNSD